MPPLSPSNSFGLRRCHISQLPRRPIPTLFSARCLSTSIDPSTPAPSLSTKKSYAALPHRRLLSLTGPDASTFLQGLTTTNIPTSLQTQGGSGFYSAFLNAAGRVLYDVFIYPATGSEIYKDQGKEEGGFLIEVDANEVQALAGHLRKFRLRRKVEVGVLDAESNHGKKGWEVHAVWDNRQGHVQDQGESSEHLGAGQIGCIDARTPGMGSRVIAQLGANLGAEEAPLENYHLRRIFYGVPEGQSEMPKETALPLESNLDIMGGIDFRKGCYVGQELTIRTHHTGVVRKRILPVVLYQHGERPPERLEDVVFETKGEGIMLPPVGANISRVAGGKGRSVGRWGGGTGQVGLALCRLEVMTDYVVGGGSQYKSDEEFKITWEEGEVLVKAFVPGWFRERVDGLKVRPGI